MEAVLPREQVSDAKCAFNAEVLRHLGLAEITVDNDHALTSEGHRDGQVSNCGGLSLTRNCRSDDDRLRRVVYVDVLKVGAHHPHCLSSRRAQIQGGEWTRGRLFIKGDDAQAGRSSDVRNGLV